MKGRLPPWFKKRIPEANILSSMRELFDELSLHTICESAQCPNQGDCFSLKTATFLILGDVCTRGCTFCAVSKGRPSAVDEKEPEHLLEAAERLGLRHVVITSVTRDDLADGGATHFVRVIQTLRQKRDRPAIEVLVPDFGGSPEAIEAVVQAKPEVINHNLETVPRLYREVRPGADYQRSLGLLGMVKNLDPRIITKSGLMVGLGETKEEVVEVMEDLRRVNCDLLTIGQYLQPSWRHHPVVRYLLPEEFSQLERIGREKGFSGVASAPLVRSSFDAARLYQEAKRGKA